MSLESFGEELRRSREQKQMSLAAISEATRISEKMLEAMEAGKFSVLPQTYIRAFLRAYARVLELNPEEILKRYDALNREVRVAMDDGVVKPKPITQAPEQSRTPAASPSFHLSMRTILVLVVIVAAFGGIIYMATRGSSAPAEDPLSKVPFDKAVHETEAAVVQPDTQQSQPPLVQAQPPLIQAQAQHPVVDSLRLEITTTDSLWISVVLDNVRKGQYLFPPQRTHTWVAKSQFVISMGNAGVATFRLNGNDLGVLGKRGAVARNVVITQSGVQQAQ